MGAHSHFYVDVAAPHQGLTRLAQTLARSVPPALADCTEIFGKYWQPKEWSFQSNELLGPGGWMLSGRQNTVEIMHILKYSSVTLETHRGAALIGGVNFFGRFFESEKVIFCHELLPVPDEPLDEIAKKLAKDFAPAKTIDAVTKAHFSDGCWAIAPFPITDLG